MANKRDKSRVRRNSGESLGRNTVWDLLGDANQRVAHPVRFLPVSLWPRHGLFLGASDSHLRRLTSGGFGKGASESKGTHPLFVLETLGNLAHRVCPCSTQRFFNQRFIDKGCRLEHTSYLVAERTYLVEECFFQVPKDSAFLWGLRYWGRVPDCCIRQENENG